MGKWHITLYEHKDFRKIRKIKDAFFNLLEICKLFCTIFILIPICVCLVPLQMVLVLTAAIYGQLCKMISGEWHERRNILRMNYHERELAFKTEGVERGLILEGYEIGEQRYFGFDRYYRVPADPQKIYEFFVLAKKYADENGGGYHNKFSALQISRAKLTSELNPHWNFYPAYERFADALYITDWLKEQGYDVRKDVFSKD